MAVNAVEMISAYRPDLSSENRQRDDLAACIK